MFIQTNPAATYTNESYSGMKNETRAEDQLSTVGIGVTAIIRPSPASV